VALPVSSAAQESRAGIIAEQQAEKAKRLAPYVPGTAERVLTRLQRGLVMSPGGVYPYFDSAYSGAGFTLGAGYRSYYGDNSQWNLRGLYAITGSKLIELSTDSVGHQGDRLDFHARVGWRDATEAPYYGLGIDTSSEDRTNYRMKQAYGGGDLRVHVTPWAFVAGGVLVEDFNIEEGKGDDPPTDSVHTPESAPGLGTNPKYFHSTVSAGVDSRRSPGYARRGGLYEIAYHNYADVDNTLSFDRADAEIIQHIPILRETWVVSLRGRFQTTLGESDVVPFFLLPALGSGSTLRAYSSWRFRDRHSMLTTAEWRWIPNRMALDMALFYDAGMVASRRQDLRLAEFKSGFGVGVRFHSPLATPLRIELAGGAEGLRVVFSGGAAF
jgi:outer membrane protein assembly factor BamA